MVDPLPPRVVRFSGSERAVHWLVAVAFFSMLGSGLAMGKRGSLHDIMYGWHLTSAGVLLVGLAIIALRADRAAISRTGRELRSIDAPDRAWLASLASASPRPPAGRFNAGQKVFFMLISLLLAALFVSGAALVITGRNPILNPTHSAASYLSVLLVAGHLYMALINPRTRPALRGMISGSVDRAWSREHHPRATTDDGIPDGASGGAPAQLGAVVAPQPDRPGGSRASSTTSTKGDS